MSALPILLLGGAAIFLMAGGKKSSSPSPRCIHARTQAEWESAKNLGGSVLYPAMIVYYPDGLDAAQVEKAFCDLAIRERMTIALVRASDASMWEGGSIGAGAVVFSSPSAYEMRTWEEIIGTPSPGAPAAPTAPTAPASPTPSAPSAPVPGAPSAPASLDECDPLGDWPEGMICVDKNGTWVLAPIFEEPELTCPPSVIEGIVQDTWDLLWEEKRSSADVAASLISFRCLGVGAIEARVIQNLVLNRVWQGCLQQALKYIADDDRNLSLPKYLGVVGDAPCRQMLTRHRYDISIYALQISGRANEAANLAAERKEKYGY